MDSITEFEKKFFLILKDSAKSQHFVTCEKCARFLTRVFLPHLCPARRITTTLSIPCKNDNNLEPSLKLGVFSPSFHKSFIELLI